MTRAQTNHFQFTSGVSTGYDSSMTVLSAVMSDFSYANHAHEEFAVGVTLGGIQEFACNGSKYRSAPGDIIVFNPGDVHDGHPGSDDALKYTMLYLDAGELCSLMSSSAKAGATEFRIPETHFRDDLLRRMILGVAKHADDQKRFCVEHEHGLSRIADRLAMRVGLFQPAGLRQDKDALLLRVREYILDNITRDISIDELCAVANLSKYHFIRFFRSQFGMTPHQYILNQKVIGVRQALGKGVPPSAVAQDFGFFDASHLNRHFKRVYGITPKQYQQQLYS